MGLGAAYVTLRADMGPLRAGLTLAKGLVSSAAGRLGKRFTAALVGGL